MKRFSRARESGVAAVEFALVVPILMAIVIGIVEFGLAFNYRTQLNNAAMAGARHYAIHHNKAQAVNVVTSTVTLPPGTPFGQANIVVRNPGGMVTPSCPVVEGIAKNTVTVTITAQRPTVTNMFGASFNIAGKATAVCM